MEERAPKRQKVDRNLHERLKDVSLRIKEKIKSDPNFATSYLKLDPNFLKPVAFHCEQDLLRYIQAIETALHEKKLDDKEKDKFEELKSFLQ